MGRDDDSIFATTYGPLYISDAAGTMKPKGHVTAKILNVEPLTYVLQLCNEEDTVLIAQPIDAGMELQFKENDILEWILRRPNYRMQRIRLICEEDLQMFKAAIAQALFESFSGQSLKDAVDESEKQWVLNTYTQTHKDNQDDIDFDMDDTDTGHFQMRDEDEPAYRDVESIKADRRTRKDESEDEEEEEEEDFRPVIRESNYLTPAKGIRPKGSAITTSTRKGKEQNSILVSGTNLNRSFVSRGSQLGVFGYSEDDELQYLNRLKTIKNAEGQVIIPGTMQLHDADKRMLIIDEQNKGKVYNLDLETAKIIDTFGGMDEVEINSIAPYSKYSQVTNEQMIVGASDSGIFSLDPRLPGQNKTAESFFYKTKGVDLTSITTTGSQYTAVASKKGDIRLFNKIGKGYCKTQLPGLGNPITNVDVTCDGTWLVATTKTYLLVFPLVLSSGKTGFEARMGQDKPTPLKLTISAEDMVKYNIDEVSFTPAKFNTGTVANSTERWIATSTGMFVITWNFDKVKEGNRLAYKIKKTDEHVVMDVFRHNYQNELVVAQNDDVFLSKLKNKK